MGKLYGSDEIIAVLRRRGFTFVSQRGSHMKFRRAGIQKLTAIVPANRKEIPRGTFLSILRQTKLSERDFES